MALSTRLLTLRRSPILLKLPPYLSALCIVVGIAWLLVLPLNEYSRQTYISENAILPGQVHTHFGGSEHNVFRAYRQEVYALSERPEEERVGGLEQVLSDQGLKVATQPYRYEVAGEVIAGTNVYGVLQGPRADATEAMVLMAGWYNVDGKINYSGVALALALGRYFKRWSIWSKDIIILIAADSTYGPEAWVSAYHSTLSEPTSSRNVSSLAIRAGALQGAVALDYPAGPWGHRFDKIDILYDGINGALPNLDLLNTAVHVASSQNGVGSSVHGVSKHADSYQDRVKALLRGIVTQSAGHATGPHSAFMPYHVDAITLKTVGNGWHDEMSLGRVTESLMRSINNLLEHFHQSFFFYILLNANRFVSIGTYLPSAMIVAGSFTINALALWLQSGKAPAKKAASPKDVKKHQEPRMDVIKEDGEVALVPHVALESVERKLALPALCLIAIHFAGLIPLYLLNNTSIQYLYVVFPAISIASFLLPASLSTVLVQKFAISTQQVQILQSLSLILLGAVLSTLATLNFSLALVVALLATPLGFVRQLSTERSIQVLLSVAAVVSMAVVAPPTVLCGVSWYWGNDVWWLLQEMARGWGALGVWTSLVVWALWWPAWIIGGTVMASGILKPVVV